MSLSIMHLLIASSSQFAAHPHFAYTLCSSAMFVSDVLGVGYGQVFCVQCLFVLRVARKHRLV